MTPPLPPDDAETRVIAGGAAPPPPAAPPELEPEPSRGLGWGMLLGALTLIAAAAIGAAIYFLTQDDGQSAATTTTTATTTAATTTTPTAVLPPNRVFVPDVTGLKQDDAVRRLGAAGLVPVIQFKPTKKPSGLVVGQEPKAAKRVKKGSSVSVFVDRGAPTVAVPDTTGLKVADARARLAEAGFKVETTQVTAADSPAGTVVSQAPAPGEKADKGAMVILSVARAPAGQTASTTTSPGATTPQTTAPRQTTTTTPAARPATATVPDLQGTDVQAASQALSEANLLASLQYVPSEEPLGTVVQQAPAAGTSVKALSHVTVNAATGPGQKEQKPVPNVVGQTLDQAVATIKAAGLRLIFVKLPVSTRAQVGKIVEQTPAAGSTAPKNAQVLVYLGVLR